MPQSKLAAGRTTAAAICGPSAVISTKRLPAGRAFPGTTFADALAGRSPEWDRLPAWVPKRVADLIRGCLQLDLKRRQRDAGDARLELEEALAELERTATTQLFAQPPTVGQRWWPLLAILVIVPA